MDITFTPEAKTTVQRMRDKCYEIAALVGHEDPLATEAHRSLAGALVSLIGLGGSVSKDGDLSLYGVNEYGIHYGVNWSLTRTVPERFADLPEHVQRLILDTCGTWSVNS